MGYADMTGAAYYNNKNDWPIVGLELLAYMIFWFTSSFISIF